MARQGAVAVVALALLVCGCGAGAEDRDDPGGESPSSDVSVSPDASPSETASLPETDEETPAVEPADGPVLEVGGYRISAPRGFRVNNDTPFADSAVGRIGEGRSGSVVMGVYATDQLSLDLAMRRSWRPNRTTPPGFKKQPTTVLGSRTAYYYTADDGRFNTDHVIGMWDGGLVELRIELPDDMPRERQSEIVESVRLTYARGES